VLLSPCVLISVYNEPCELLPCSIQVPAAAAGGNSRASSASGSPREDDGKYADQSDNERDREKDRVKAQQARAQAEIKVRFRMMPPHVCRNPCDW